MPPNTAQVSGAAFMRQHDWLLHHGTMLLDVDFAALGGVLTPSTVRALQT